MNIDFKAKKVELSAREFACFDFNFENREIATSSMWTMFLGTQWHRTIQKESQESGKKVQSEVQLKADLVFGDWLFCISGNADEVFEEDGYLLVREIKTTRKTFPIDKMEYTHSIQLAFYVYALSKTSYAKGELLYVNINTGLSQSFQLYGKAIDILKLRAEKFIDYLKERELANIAIGDLDLSLPFETLREGQAQAIEALQSLDNEKIVSFNAPTAFGKTAISLSVALDKLQSGEIDNIICLSSKSSGQLQFIRELRKFIRGGVYPKCFQIRNRSEHILNDFRGNCTDCLNCEVEHFGEFVFDFKNYFSSSIVSLDKIKSDALEYGLCPYKLSLAMLPYAQVWICDYNYIFSPSVRGVFDNEDVFNPKRTMLILDEAHNLEGRVELAYSGKISLDDLLILKTALNLDFPDLALYLNSIIDTLENSQLELCLDEISLIKGNLARILNHATKLNLDELLPYAKGLLYNILALAKHTKMETIKLYYKYEAGVFSVDCYEAFAEKMQVLNKFKYSLLLSASEMSLPENGITEHSFKPTWLTKCYRHIFDTSADTRANSRYDYLENTAKSIYVAKKHSSSPLIVFFPSYLYAKRAMEVFSRRYKNFSTCIQAKNLSYAKQIEFLEVSLLGNDIICLIMASSFAESIDILGGRVDTAMIVSVGYPEINDKLNAKMQLLMQEKDMTKREAFIEVYAKQAHSKIRQAVGRLVRSPEHKATIIYHCQRFLEAPFDAYFKKEIAQNLIAKNAEELENLLLD
ncbi:MAG: helicase C-terminal domain-containing protein [Opitutales bacterium]